MMGRQIEHNPLIYKDYNHDMKQSLQLNLSQHLAMTPQLQQAIRLLQLSTLELQVEVQEALEANPLLERTEDDVSGNADVDAPAPTDNTAEPDAISTSSEADIPDELAIDTTWDEVYDNLAAQPGMGTPDTAEFETQRSAAESLSDHLISQLNFIEMTPRDHTIALAIIDSINPDGYVTAPLSDIYEGLFSAEVEPVEMDEAEAVLHLIQNFDPLGVGARDPGECLNIQLHQLSPNTEWLAEAQLLASEHLDLLASQDLVQLRRKLKVTMDDLPGIIALIRSLHPRPGSLIEQSQSQYIIPDVFIRKDGDKWVVTLNAETVPKLRINAGYAGMVRRGDGSEANTFLKNHLQEARWFLKSIQSRNETLIKVANSILEHQINFFELGEEAMKPLVLRDVALSVDMHESTISRVTTNKYMHTPAGIFEFKYFFSSHVTTNAGGECSSTAIRAFIRKLVGAELPKKPLSDNKIAIILSEQGIKVARRTVAKYREAMSIPSSSERKRLL